MYIKMLFKIIIHANNDLKYYVYKHTIYKFWYLTPRNTLKNLALIYKIKTLSKKKV